MERWRRVTASFRSIGRTRRRSGFREPSAVSSCGTLRREGEVLPGRAVPAEGLYAPGCRPGGDTAGGADVQRPEGAAAALSPAH